MAGYFLVSPVGQLPSLTFTRLLEASTLHTPTMGSTYHRPLPWRRLLNRVRWCCLAQALLSCVCSDEGGPRNRHRDAGHEWTAVGGGAPEQAPRPQSRFHVRPLRGSHQGIIWAQFRKRGDINWCKTI